MKLFAILMFLVLLFLCCRIVYVYAHSDCVLMDGGPVVRGFGGNYHAAEWVCPKPVWNEVPASSGEKK